LNRNILTVLILIVSSSCAWNPANAQTAEKQLVSEAGIVLREVMAIPDRGIPRSLLSEAQGLVIVPGMIRGGFVVGVKHGRGIAVARDDGGVWSNPVFVRVTGGSIGWQAGLQSTDLILVFRTRSRVEEMMRARFTIGANASATAGPVGRTTSAATDAQLRSEIWSYSRSRGLFAGVAIDGVSIQPDHRATATFYGQTPSNPQGRAPAVAGQFLSVLNSFSGTPADAALPIPHRQRETLCRQLTAAHQRLLSILDPAWQRHLALPADVSGTTPASLDALRQAHTRFNNLLGEPQFRTLVDRQEFQETLTLLNRHILVLEAANASILQLPSPPG
jgi:lipid-binding SYLF domain-containing protein